jgi:hypothetical protein
MILKLEKPTSPDVVEYLQEVLDKARVGEVSGVLIVSQGPGGISYCVAGLKDRLLISGWLFHAIYRLQSDGPTS